MADITDGTSNTLMMSERLKANYGIRTVGNNEIQNVLGLAVGVRPDAGRSMYGVWGAMGSKQGGEPPGY